MKQIKVSETTPIQLDWLVAKCKGRNFVHGAYEYSTVDERVWASGISPVERRYSTDWAHGGPIIEREKIDLEFMDNFEAWCGSVVREYGQDRESYSDDQDRESYTAEQESFVGYGPTPLIAAMRCYVTLKMGDVVEVPEELE